MLEQLLDLVKSHAGNAIINNQNIPNEKNNEAIGLASNSILSGIQQAIAGGNIKDVLSMFGGQHDLQQNPVAQNIQSGFLENLKNQLGLDQNQAAGAASGLIPGVLQKLVHKTNDPADKQFDIQSLFNQVTGGQSSGMDIQSLLSKFKSGAFDADGDGDTDLQDVMAKLKGTGSGGGGIMDTIKNIFK